MKSEQEEAWGIESVLGEEKVKGTRMTRRKTQKDTGPGHEIGTRRKQRNKEARTP
jgi:hypothetical protein